MARFPAMTGLAMLLAVNAAAAGGFRLVSTDLESGGTIGRQFVYDNHGCNGGNRSPALSWSGSPAGTKSFAVTVHDPDAPRSGGWWHWVVHDIPAGARALARGASRQAMPDSALEGRNSFGASGYGGPCPPAGDEPHRYVFKVYALDTATLDLSEDVGPGAVASALSRHALASAELVARYGR